MGVKPRDPTPDWFQREYGRNRDALRGTEWERWVRWAWEDDESPGPACPVSSKGQQRLGL